MCKGKNWICKWLPLLVLLPFVCNGFIVQEKKVKQLKANVQQVIDYIHTNGEDKAFKEISNPKGKFSHKDSYVFVVSYKGVRLAHPWLKVGENDIDLLDEYGTPFIKLFIEAAKAGGGPVGYYWKKPSDETIKFKISYVKPAAKKDYFVGSGFYE